LGNLEYVKNYTSDEKADNSQKLADYFIESYVSNFYTYISIDRPSDSDAESFDNVIDALDDLKEQLKKYK
jgi:hypothetical protein